MFESSHPDQINTIKINNLQEATHCGGFVVSGPLLHGYCNCSRLHHQLSLAPVGLHLNDGRDSVPLAVRPALLPPACWLAQLVAMAWRCSGLSLPGNLRTPSIFAPLRNVLTPCSFSAWASSTTPRAAAIGEIPKTPSSPRRWRRCSTSCASRRVRTPSFVWSYTRPDAVRCTVTLSGFRGHSSLT